MADERGAHGLGPHVVGLRVVVRRVLPGETGPTGGPAMTDVLGICLSWADGVCVVQPEIGPAVRIAVSEIVSGKPVPPRPAVRSRISAQEAQVRGGALFPDLVTEPLDGWLLRRSDESSARRANSVLAMSPSSASIAEVVEWYAAAGRRPIAAVLPDSAEERLFADAGWVLEADLADTAFQLAGVAAARRASPRPLEDLPLTELAPACVRVEIPGRASGIAAYADDWVGFRAIAVDPEHRRQGLGLAVMSTLLAWGAEQGARTAYLQVTSDNMPALGMYAGLGFVTHHEYRYLTP